MTYRNDTSLKQIYVFSYQILSVSYTRCLVMPLFSENAKSRFKMREKSETKQSDNSKRLLPIARLSLSRPLFLSICKDTGSICQKVKRFKVCVRSNVNQKASHTHTHVPSPYNLLQISLAGRPPHSQDKVQQCFFFFLLSFYSVKCSAEVTKSLVT
jgi:hypothetical protein